MHKAGTKAKERELGGVVGTGDHIECGDAQEGQIQAMRLSCLPTFQTRRRRRAWKGRVTLPMERPAVFSAMSTAKWNVVLEKALPSKEPFDSLIAWQVT